jgi:Protein of unknown function (DUF2568)
MIVFKSLALTVRFLLELAALGAVGWWGFETGDGVAGWVLGLGAPLLVAVVWGAFISPKATVKVPKAVWVGLQVLVFGAAALALAAVAPGWVAVAFVAVVVLDSAALAVLGV